MKSKIILLAVTLAVIISANGCGLMSKKYLKTETVRYQINTAGKKKMKIENVSGNISISHSKDSGSVSVKAIKETKVKKKYLDTPFSEIEVTLDTAGSTINIKTDINKKEEGGIFIFESSHYNKVNYEITVPANMEIEVENVNGNVTSDNLNNDIKINLVNGEVSADSYTGNMECDITNGSFSGQIDSTRGLNINTVNGSVTLNLSNFINAKVKAQTVNGRITDENLKFSDVDRERKSFKGKLGSGNSDTDIRIETINGKIRLIGRNEI